MSGKDDRKNLKIKCFEGEGIKKRCHY